MKVPPVEGEEEREGVRKGRLFGIEVCTCGYTQTRGPWVVKKSKMVVEDEDFRNKDSPVPLRSGRNILCLCYDRCVN